MNSHRQQNRIQYGFTLIELLVVIAIIGLLSSVVLASLNTARKKADDAQIKSDLNSIRTQAALYYNEHNNTYGTAHPTSGGAQYDCTQSGTSYMVNDSQIHSALNQIVQVTSNKLCADTGTAYMFEAKLPGNSQYWWCIDSTGAGEFVSAQNIFSSGWIGSALNTRCIP